MILTTSIPRRAIIEYGDDHVDREAAALKRQMLTQVAERMHREFVCVETTIRQDYSTLCCVIECRALFFQKTTRSIMFDEPTTEWGIFSPPAQITAQQPANDVMRGIEL
jgi:hypothetical protein